MLFDKTALNPYDYAWMNLPVDAVKEYLNTRDTFNPFDARLPIELENRGLREILLMYDPHYLFYTVKMLLNIELHIMQAVVIEQFFTHAFPMLVDSLIRKSLYSSSSLNSLEGLDAFFMSFTFLDSTTSFTLTIYLLRSSVSSLV